MDFWVLIYVNYVSKYGLFGDAYKSFFVTLQYF